MPRKEADAGPRLLLRDYGNGAQQWLESYAAAPDSYKRARPSDEPSSISEIHVLIEPQTSRTERWLERFARERAEFGPYGGPPPNLKPNEAPHLDLLLHDFASGPRFVQQVSGLFSRNGAAAGSAATEPLPEAAADLRPAPKRTAPVPADADLDLNLLLGSEDAAAQSLRHRSRATSVAAHAILIATLIMQPHVVPPRQPEENLLQQMETVSLVAPPASVLAELTRPVPSQRQAVEVFEPIPEQRQPAVTPARAEPLEVVQPPEPPKVQPEPTPEPVAPAPKLEIEQPPPRELAAARSPAPGLTREGENQPRLRPNELPVLNAPKRTNEPKLPANRQTATGLGQDGELQLGSLRLNARPDEVIQAATENLIASGGTQIVGDGYAASGLGSALPPSEGNRGSTLELLSDPKGVDFRPYLIQVLAAVRRNWYAVIPESARLGMTRGRVAIQFIISNEGMVPKLVIADSSGTPHLDRAAVAGISASVPFQPLPSEFTGDEIRLQFVFLYNTKR